MTISNDKGKKTAKGAKKLSVKKETVKDLDTGPRKGKELGDDQLDAVNGGMACIFGKSVRLTMNPNATACALVRTTPRTHCCP